MQIIVRSLVLFLFVWVVTRGMGRKELAELSSFELILVIAMGDLIQQGVTGDDRSLTGAMLAVATFALLTVAFSYLSFRSTKIARVAEGRPRIIIRDGEVFDDVVRVERLTLDEVKDAAREQGIADLRQIHLGVLEADGRFSFIRVDAGRSPAPRHTID
jgi:uncharacterized membrane protein YcaP (DUF421 family)